MARLFRGRALRASYDAAQTTDDNTQHWANADALSADAAASSSVRATLRQRTRYEVANNSLARGIVDTLANDMIGPGPVLQLLTAEPDINGQIESLWSRWADEIDLAGKLRTMRIARVQDGEAFGVLATNGRLEHPVKLDLVLVEADRVASPTGLLEADNEVDGIVFDAFGNPERYCVQRVHPGSNKLSGLLDAYDTVEARRMLHWFRPTRPEQHRGVPELTPALELFALLRRYLLATVTAAETAADLAIIMKTSAPPSGEAADVQPWVTMDLVRNMAMFAPEGWEPYQMRAEQPTAGFDGFTRAIVANIARCLNVPYCVAAGDSSQYNYASGRLDHQTYFKSLEVDRADLGRHVLDRTFGAWLGEALLIPGLHLARQLERVYWPHAWFWRNREHVDPLKEALAAIAKLKAGLLTEAEYQAREGRDWEGVLEQRRRELAARKAAGLPQPWEAGARGGAKPRASSETQRAGT